MSSGFQPESIRWPSCLLPSLSNSSKNHAVWIRSSSTAPRQSHCSGKFNLGLHARRAYSQSIWPAMEAMLPIMSHGQPQHSLCLYRSAGYCCFCLHFFGVAFIGFTLRRRHAPPVLSLFGLFVYGHVRMESRWMSMSIRQASTHMCHLLLCSANSGPGSSKSRDFTSRWRRRLRCTFGLWRFIMCEGVRVISIVCLHRNTRGSLRALVDCPLFRCCYFCETKRKSKTR